MVQLTQIQKMEIYSKQHKFALLDSPLLHGIPPMARRGRGPLRLAVPPAYAVEIFLSKIYF